MSAHSAKQWSRQLMELLCGRKSPAPAGEAFSLFIEGLIGTTPCHIELYQQALTHSSYHTIGAEQERCANNERLEFLGDAILHSAVSATLYHLHPTKTEGQLSHLRSLLVSRKNMNALALRLGLDQHLRYNPSFLLSTSDAIGNALEALIGAIYLDLGYPSACQFVARHVVVSEEHVKRLQQRGDDYKSAFIQLMQQKKVPYHFADTGSQPQPNGSLLHYCEIVVGSDHTAISSGVGTSKKKAHQNAAKDALRLIGKVGLCKYIGYANTLNKIKVPSA